MRILLFLFILILSSSCSGDLTKYGKVQRYKAASSRNHAFSFKVEGEFALHSDPTKRDEKHMLMNEDEVNLLNKLLVGQKLCLDEYSYPSYVITSKQRKIYDVTFANLIDQNYNAKPVAPLTYYGRCV